MENYREIILLASEVDDAEKFLNKVIKKTGVKMTTNSYFSALKLLEQGNDVALCLFVGQKQKEVVHVSTIKK